MKCFRKNFVLLSFLLLGQSWVFAQVQNSSQMFVNAEDSLAVYVDLDSVVVNAFEVQDKLAAIIQIIKMDTTFYKAFKNLHFSTYNADNVITIFNKNRSEKASLVSETKHIYRDDCRKMLILEELINGDYYNRKQKPNYYTAEMYEALFFSRKPVCGEVNKLDLNALNEKGSSLDKHKAQLKKLMFSPGSKISGIPFIGNKASIFDAEIAAKYDFRLTTAVKDDETTYLFEATPKPQYKNDVVYQEFKTWIRLDDFAILGRNYHLKYSTMVYDFDIKIKVNLQTKGNMLLVKTIDYDGNWRAITQGREIVKFKSIFYH